MRKEYGTKQLTALLTALAMLLCMLPSGVVSEGEEESVVCSDFTVPAGIVTDYTIQASDDAEIAFDPASGAAKAIIIRSGTVKLSNQGTSTERIIVEGNARLILAGVNVQPTDGPAVKAAPGVNVRVELAEGTSNTLKGASEYAGLEVGWAGSNSFATVTIQGKGSLNATGGSKSAGIGASYKNLNASGNAISAYCGNIIIESGNITAVGNEGAGIGTANNNRKCEDGTTSFSASYKMTVNSSSNDLPKWGTITINGGTINASCNGGGAGIGGGNHVDANKITINGGHITATGGGGGGAGIGCGIGSQKQESNLTKGPGYYNATIEINGGSITAKGTWLGAGIGGGYACDAKISINGGTINATGGNGNSGANYQGAPGIGAGYMGIPQLTITAGTIKAQGGTGAPGIGYGPGALAGDTAKERGKDATYKYDASFIDISGGTISATGGINGAGIGGGNGNQHLHIRISGGDITAKGYSDRSNLKFGGAGIGSGTGLDGGATKYKSDTEVDISISGNAKILAIGGWGASGIGSGAKNKMANSISISGNADIEAYADGTKFAIDTRVLDDAGMTTSKQRDISVPILQGTFVHHYTTADGTDQNPEGLNPVQVINEKTGTAVTLTKMPDGYRSFATDVSGAGTYTVYTNSDSIGEGGGRYFKQTAKDVFNENEIINTGIQYTVSGGSLSDHFYLFPIKSVVVEKELAAETGTDLSGLNATFSFGLYHWAEEGLGEQEGTTQEISVVNGVPQGKAYFTDVPDGKYEIVETDGNGGFLKAGTVFGTCELKKITTADSEGGTTNNGTIDERQWTDRVTVRNTFGKISTSLSGTKTWNDEDNANGIRPDSITVYLCADGQVMEDRSATVSADTEWQYRFEDLDKYREDGTEIRYSVTEDPVPESYEVQYTEPVTTGSGTVADIENTYIPKEISHISLTVVKQWNDMDDLDGTRPGSVTVTLLADGEEIRKITLNKANKWTATADELPETGPDGTAIQYSWKEKAVNGYTAVTVNNGNTTTITNTHHPKLISVSVSKIWDDQDNKAKIRPEKVVMKLNNGMSAVLNEENGWTATIDDLPESYQGVKIEYTWTETEVIGYVLSGTTVDGNKTIFTNKPWTRPDTPTGGKVPKEPGETLEVIPESGTPLGIDVQINHAGDCFD